MTDQGFCAKCLGVNLNYGYIVLEGGQAYFPYVCEECKHEGKEWYNLEFIETI